MKNNSLKIIKIKCLILWRFNFILSILWYFDIDGGSNTPDWSSGTKIFEELGWNIINIESLNNMYSNLILKKPLDINLSLCVGEKKDEVDLYIQDKGTKIDKRYTVNN